MKQLTTLVTGLILSLGMIYPSFSLAMEKLQEHPTQPKNTFDILSKNKSEKKALSKIEKLGDKSIQLYSTDTNANFPIHIAVKKGFSKTIDYLIKKAPHTIYGQNSDGQTPLMVCADLPNAKLAVSIAPSLIDPTYVNVTDNNSRTALMYAAHNNNIELMELLIKNKADVNQLDDHKMNALMHLLVSKKGNLQNKKDGLLLLMKNGVDLRQSDITNQNVLHYAAQLNAADHLNLILEKAPKEIIDQTDNTGLTPLHCASVQNDPSSAQALCKYGADINARNPITKQTPICYACTALKAQVATFLKNNNADPKNIDLDGNSAFNLAILLENNKLIKTFYEPELCNKKDSYGNTPIMLIAHRGKAKILAFLLKRLCESPSYKKYLSTKNSINENALHLAIKSGQLKSVRLLCECASKEDLMEKDSLGGTLLHLAVTSGNLEVVKYIEQLGMIDINTALHCSLPGFSKIVPPDTALIIALKRGHADIAKFLIESGAIINAEQLELANDSRAYKFPLFQLIRAAFMVIEQKMGFELFAQIHLDGDPANISNIKKLIKIDKKGEFTNEFIDWCNQKKIAF